MLVIKKGNIGRERREKEQDLKIGLISEASEEEVRIELLIRERYSMSQETALHRKAIMGTLPDDEWDEYTNYIEECIRRARANE